MSLAALLTGFVMVKLLLCLISAFLVAAALLHLRHERMEINYRINQAHRRLQSLQVELWNQQTRMGFATGPAAVEKTVGNLKLKLVPAAPLTRADGED